MRTYHPGSLNFEVLLKAYPIGWQKGGKASPFDYRRLVPVQVGKHADGPRQRLTKRREERGGGDPVARKVVGRLHPLLNILYALVVGSLDLYSCSQGAATCPQRPRAQP